MSFYRPYKGLKLVCIINSSVYHVKVFIVPIRDWNLIDRHFTNNTMNSFYRPYKGLKPIYMKLFLKKQISFYRPYKGLKLIHIIIYIICVVFCFYRPYKGLKPKKSYHKQKSHLFVFIVPIRDWNLVEKVAIPSELVSFYRPYKGLKQKLFDKLTGRETSFYRPYKGLKPFSEIVFSCGLSKFLSSL